MGMEIKTNNSSISTHKTLKKNKNTVSKSLEKLSTGLSINCAADDASGLSISEKLKAQITAIDTASSNAEDGASLIQTAEGYLTEVHDMLNRIVELAQKSANGIYETVDEGATAEVFGGTSTSNGVQTVLTGTDRQAIQDEVDQICAEIDRIAETASFNNIMLMDGTLDKENSSLNYISNIEADTVSNGVTTAGKITVSTGAGDGAALKLQIGETATTSDLIEVNLKNIKTEFLFAKMGDITTTSANGRTNINGDFSVENGEGKVNLIAKNAVSANENGVTINVSNQNSASYAVTKVRDIVNEVSLQRTALGAIQSKLEYTINNLNTTSENLNYSNSYIRDTEMAKEMMNFTQNNIISQAAQSMMVHTNQAPQSILQLMQ